MARPIAGQVACLQVPRSGHAMLQQSQLWHRLTAGFVAAAVRGESFDSVVAVAHEAGCRDCQPQGDAT
jgi:hypothetical protein